MMKHMEKMNRENMKIINSRFTKVENVLNELGFNTAAVYEAPDRI